MTPSVLGDEQHLSQVIQKKSQCPLVASSPLVGPASWFSLCALLLSRFACFDLVEISVEFLVVARDLGFLGTTRPHLSSSANSTAVESAGTALPLALRAGSLVPALAHSPSHCACSPNPSTPLGHSLSCSVDCFTRSRDALMALTVEALVQQQSYCLLSRPALTTTVRSHAALTVTVHALSLLCRHAQCSLSLLSQYHPALTVTALRLSPAGELHGRQLQRAR